MSLVNKFRDFIRSYKKSRIDFYYKLMYVFAIIACIMIVLNIFIFRSSVLGYVALSLVFVQFLTLIMLVREPKRLEKEKRIEEDVDKYNL